MRVFVLAAALLVAAPAFAQSAPGSATAILSAVPAGTRIGLLVIDAQGREVAAINADQRFIPASNTKLFTTAAALALLAPDAPAQGALIGLIPKGRGAPDVVLAGFGTLSLSTQSDCVTGCFSTLIDRVAGQARTVHDVIVDDSAYADQRWSPGMSWNNIGTDSGTAASAVAIDDNEVPIAISPGQPGQLPQIAVSPYFDLTNDVVTVAQGETRIGIDRAVGSRAMRVYGTIRTDAPVWRDRLGLDDPADYAGWLVMHELATRGVKVRGVVRRIHRQVAAGPAARPYKLGFSATLPGAAVGDEVRLINKVSQNLHAELLLRRLAGAVTLPTGVQASVDSLEQGLAAARSVFDRAGIKRLSYDFSDGSGMSTYNRISPRAAVTLLRWSAAQPWAATFRASLPIGGVDGTLRRRFVGTPLAGKLWAKTGTLNATNALSGWMIAASGRELTFSIIANDVPDGTNALATIDAALVAIAAAN